MARNILQFGEGGRTWAATGAHVGAAGLRAVLVRNGSIAFARAALAGRPALITESHHSQEIVCPERVAKHTAHKILTSFFFVDVNITTK